MFSFINSYSSEYFLYGLHKTFQHSTKWCKIDRFKDRWIQFSSYKFIKNWIFFENLFDVFLLSRNTYFDEQLVTHCSCLYLTRPPSIIHKQRHFYLMLKKQLHCLLHSQSKRKCQLCSNLHFTEAPTRSCPLNKSVHH